MKNENPHRIVADAVGAEAVDQSKQHQHTTPPPSVQSRGTLLDWVLTYARRGWAPVPIPEGKKAPLVPGWQKLRISESDVPAHFNGRGNIGIILGEASGRLVDVDLDCREALQFGSSLLPTTGATFGRARKRNSHWLYQVNGAAPSLQFKDPITGDMLLELRGDGGRQTVFPPSIHPSGESIEWEADGAPSVTEYAALKKAVTMLAARCLVARYLPTVTQGSELLSALPGIDARVVQLIRAWLELRAPAERASAAGEGLWGQPLPPRVRNTKSRSIATRSIAALAEARIGERPTFSTGPILEACAQMRELRDNAANQDRDSWWSCLGVLAYCEDGDKVAHDLSNKHGKYTYQETQRELDGWRRKADGATLCETFERKRPGICCTCPHRGKISSPISLGASRPERKRGDDSDASDDALIDELASLSIIAYAKRRKEAAKQLGIGVTTLDKAVDRRRAELEGEARAQPYFSHWTVEPWPEPVDGDAMILALVRRIQSHIVMTRAAALTVALWIMLAWVHEEAAIHSPILMVTSPEPDCGKTTLLGLIGFLVPRSLPSVGISPAALYRSIEKWAPTLMIDEADVMFAENEDLRAVVNSGWTRGQGVLRCEGDDHEPRLFLTFCPKAIGLKGRKLPDTTASRAIIIELKRKLAYENVTDFRHVDDPGLQELRQQHLRWAIDNAEALKEASPTLPSGFANRLAANWHLLLAIAEAIGGEWPEKARETATTIAKLKATLDASIGIQLLSDIRDVFGGGTDRLFSLTLIDKLTADPEGAWAGYNRGKPFTQKQLASRLRDYGILSETIWIDNRSAKGYKRTAFVDVWTRYLQA